MPALCPLYPQERTLGGASKFAFGCWFMSTRPSQNEEIGMTNQDPKEGMAPRAGFEPALQRSDLRITKPLVALLHSVELATQGR